MASRTASRTRSLEAQPDLRTLCQAASEELDSGKLMALVAELLDRLDEPRTLARTTTAEVGVRSGTTAA